MSIHQVQQQLSADFPKNSSSEIKIPDNASPYSLEDHQQVPSHLGIRSIPNQPMDSYLKVLYCDQEEIEKCEQLFGINEDQRKIDDDSFKKIVKAFD